MKRMVMVLCTSIMFAMGFVTPLVQAESVNDLAIKKAEMKEKIQASISKADQEVSQVNNEITGLNKQIQQVDQAIRDNQNKIVKAEADIVETTSEIKQLEKELVEIEKRITKRNEQLKERAKSYQESGRDVSYLEVLLGSESFSDFVDRVGAVVMIAEADRELLEQYEADKKDHKNKQDSLQQKLADLSEKKADLEGMQAQLKEQQKQYALRKEQLAKIEEKKIASKAESHIKASNLTVTKQKLDSQANLTDGAAAQNTNRGTNGNIKTVITAGYKYIGNSVYVFGGGRNAYDIANGRFDCSGFVHWAFSQAGIKVGSSTDSLKNSGRQISVKEMQPGDLVFFDTFKKDGHVGIYIGKGKFIGSQSSTGVAIADMSTGYWKQKFNGRVVRI
ncbi:NLP/P60 protein [Bacillus methanolicus PB1]|uniref:NLP/P60 protein n=1 Tax=Bacillus methanolicus PB1 TaxID=997296 RepID=I3DVM3_BACMT|nr:NLP/P60 protein [Bacillus methanolicus PB1]